MWRLLSQVPAYLLTAFSGVGLLLLVYMYAGHDMYAGYDRPLRGSFSTSVGMHRCEKLPDGSDVCLNTN